MPTAKKTWNHTLQKILPQACQIPLWGNPPPFPLQSFTSVLASMWQAPPLQITCKKTDWLRAEHLKEGFGLHPVTQSFTASPLEGRCFWLLAPEAMQRLTLMLLQSSSSFPTTTNALPFLDGFYQFLLLQALGAFPQVQAFSELTFQLAEEIPLPKEPMLAIDLAIGWEQEIIYGRILVTQQFLSSFQAFYQEKNRETPNLELAASIEVPLSIQIGHTEIGLEEWQHAVNGDFILLDRCSYDIKKRKGSAKILLENTPILQVRLDSGKLVILDYALYDEEESNMQNQPFEDDKKEKEDELPFSQDPEEESVDQGEAPPHETSEESEGPTPKSPPLAQEIQKLVSTHEISLSLSVEVARIRMNLEKLLQLQPGNVLELGIHPEEGVNLISGTQCVAKGELVNLGEVLGIKITEIGQ